MTHEQFVQNLVRRVAETFDEDERVAAELRARLPEAVRIIIGTLGPRRITLYGSLATGLFFASRSDVDLAIEGLGYGPSDELALALRQIFDRKVDLVDPALVAPHIQRGIEQKGRVIYEP